ncbi:hypothetical protein EE612_049713, partial [Oryza sativa]
VAVADGPVQPHRHPPVQLHLEIGPPEAVLVLVDEEGVVAGAEVHLVTARPLLEGDDVVGELRRDVDVAAADAGALAVHGAPRVAAVGDAAGVVEATVDASAAAVPVLCPRHGVASQDDEHVALVGDAVHAVLVELYVAVEIPGDVAGGVVALVCHGQHHL